jgi:hypothetical protein
LLAKGCHSLTPRLCRRTLARASTQALQKLSELSFVPTERARLDACLRLSQQLHPALADRLQVCARAVSALASRACKGQQERASRCQHACGDGPCRCASLLAVARHAQDVITCAADSIAARRQQVGRPLLV